MAITKEIVNSPGKGLVKCSPKTKRATRASSKKAAQFNGDSWLSNKFIMNCF